VGKDKKNKKQQRITRGRAVLTNNAWNFSRASKPSGGKRTWGNHCTTKKTGKARLPRKAAGPPPIKPHNKESSQTVPITNTAATELSTPWRKNQFMKEYHRRGINQPWKHKGGVPPEKFNLGKLMESIRGC